MQFQVYSLTNMNYRTNAIDNFVGLAGRSKMLSFVKRFPETYIGRQAIKGSICSGTLAIS